MTPTAEQRAEWRWRTYPRAIVATVIVAVLIVSLNTSEEDTLPDQFGGDLTVYFSAGEIVRSGDGHRLFDLDRQAEAQAGYWENETSRILYVYPPILAAVYAPLTGLGYQAVYLIHTAVMLGALFLSVRLLGSLVPWMADPTRRLAALAFGLAFLPLFVGSMIGQNTALVVLAVTSVWWGLERRRDAVAGLAAGLLLLKPQYGVPVVGLVFLARRWTAFGAAVATGAAIYATSALVSGPAWVADWWELAGKLSTVDQGANLTREVSILGMAETFLGSGSSVAFGIWVVGLGVVVGAVLWRLRQRPMLDPYALALVPPMLVLIAPHSLYYDAGVLLLSLAVLLTTVAPARRTLVLATWLAGGAAYLLHDLLGFQPVALLVLATLTWAWWASTPRPDLTSPDAQAATVS